MDHQKGKKNFGLHIHLGCYFSIEQPPTGQFCVDPSSLWGDKIALPTCYTKSTSSTPQTKFNNNPHIRPPQVLHAISHLFTNYWSGNAQLSHCGILN